MITVETIEEHKLSDEGMPELEGVVGFVRVTKSYAGPHEIFKYIVSIDEITPGDKRWHVSVSGQDRVPHWNEFVAVVHHLRPGVVFCVPMPPASMWINSQHYTLHVWEIKDTNLIDQWQFEGKGDTPT